MAIADELIALLGFELTGEDAAKRYEATLKRVERTAERVGEAIGTGIKVAAAAGAAAFTLLSRSVINVNAEFESYQATLETIEGSAEKARESLDWIAEFGKTTPYDVAQVTEAFVRLKAYGIDPIANDTMRTLGDTASAMGKTLEQAVEMFADASTGEFERLKEFGIKAKQEGDNVTFSWTKDGQELTETVKKNATEIRAFLLETLGDRFTGAMDRQSRTFRGMTSNLGDSWTDFQRRIGEAGFFDKVKGQLESLLNTIQRLDREGKLDEWAAAISGALSTALNIFVAIATRIAENTQFLIENWDSLKPVAIALAGAIGLLVAKAFPVMFVFGLMAVAVDDFLAYLQGGESVIGDFIEWIRSILPVSEEVAATIAGLGAAVATGLLAAFALKPVTVTMIAVRMIAALSAAIAPLLLSALTALGAAGGPILSGLAAAFAFLATPVGWAVILAGIAAALVAYFWDDLIAIWNSVEWSQLGTAIVDGIMAGLRAAGNQIQEWINRLVPGWLREWIDGGGLVGYMQREGMMPGGNAAAAGAAIGAMAGNYQGNTSTQNGATDATVQDFSQDNRQFPQTNNITVNQTVQQPTNAPSQAAQATGQAVQQSVTQQRTQIEQEPAF